VRRTDSGVQGFDITLFGHWWHAIAVDVLPGHQKPRGHGCGGSLGSGHSFAGGQGSGVIAPSTQVVPKAHEMQFDRAPRRVSLPKVPAGQGVGKELFAGQ
jgi:hypothetical protein